MTKATVKEDGHVAPEMRISVLKGRGDVVIATDFEMARPSTGHGANLVDDADPCVSGTGRDELSAPPFGGVELVHHEGLKSVRHWVDIFQPLEPRVHAGHGNDVPSVDRQHKHQDTHDAVGLFGLFGGGRDSAEQRRHGRCSKERNENEDEECARILLQADHEVDDHVEDENSQGFEGVIGKSRRERVNERMVEAVRAQFLHDRPLGVLRADLRHGLESVEEHTKNRTPPLEKKPDVVEVVLTKTDPLIRDMKMAEKTVAMR